MVGRGVRRAGVLPFITTWYRSCGFVVVGGRKFLTFLVKGVVCNRSRETVVYELCFCFAPAAPFNVKCRLTFSE